MHPFALLFVDFFNDCAVAVCGQLNSISLLPLLGALLALAAMQLARARAWQNILDASFPKERDSSYRRLASIYLIGAGVNAVVPARAGEAVKLFLAKRELPSSTYPALASTLVTLTVFDTVIGVIVLVLAFQWSVLPIEDLPHLPLAAITAIASSIFLALVIAWFRIPIVRRALHEARNGVRVLGHPLFYFRKIASWEALGWLLRFAALSLLLRAFGISGNFQNVFLVMSIQALACLLPLSPSGAGTQQAMLLATLQGISSSTILFYSIGAQVVTAVCSVALGLAALWFVFQTMDWRELLRISRADRHVEPASELAS